MRASRLPRPCRRQARRAAPVFPRGRAGQPARIVAAARRACRRGAAERGTAAGAPPCRLLAGHGAINLDRLAAALALGPAMIPIIFCRALLLASDTAPVDALCATLAARGLAPAPLIVPSLTTATPRTSCAALARLRPSAIVTMTAFAAGGGEAETRRSTPATCRCSSRQRHHRARARAGWRRRSCHARRAPRLDSRILAGIVAFKVRCRRRNCWVSPRSRAGLSLIASRWWPIASRPSFACAKLRAPNAASRC